MWRDVLVQRNKPQLCWELLRCGEVFLFVIGHNFEYRVILRFEDCKYWLKPNIHWLKKNAVVSLSVTQINSTNKQSKHLNSWYLVQISQLRRVVDLFVADVACLNVSSETHEGPWLFFWQISYLVHNCVVWTTNPSWPSLDVIAMKLLVSFSTHLCTCSWCCTKECAIWRKCHLAALDIMVWCIRHSSKTGHRGELLDGKKMHWYGPGLPSNF